MKRFLILLLFLLCARCEAASILFYSTNFFQTQATNAILVSSVGTNSDGTFIYTGLRQWLKGTSTNNNNGVYTNQMNGGWYEYQVQTLPTDPPFSTYPAQQFFVPYNDTNTYNVQGLIGVTPPYVKYQVAVPLAAGANTSITQTNGTNYINAQAGGSGATNAVTNVVAGAGISVVLVTNSTGITSTVLTNGLPVAAATNAAFATNAGNSTFATNAGAASTSTNAQNLTGGTNSFAIFYNASGTAIGGWTNLGGSLFGWWGYALTNGYATNALYATNLTGSLPYAQVTGTPNTNLFVNTNELTRSLSFAGPVALNNPTAESLTVSNSITAAGVTSAGNINITSGGLQVNGNTSVSSAGGGSFTSIKDGNLSTTQLVGTDSSIGNPNLISIALGTGLSFSGTTLNATGGGSSTNIINTLTNDPRAITLTNQANTFSGNGAGLTNYGFGQIYNVKVQYNGSDATNQTTGAITNGTAVLVVASTNTFAVGQGVWIAGAGTNGVQGGNLGATILSMNGTALTISVNAGTTVTGARVQHENCFAINQAIIDWSNAHGGIVKLPGAGTISGQYRLNWFQYGTNNGNSLITVPLYTNHFGVPATLFLLGDARGGIPDNTSGVYWGTCLNTFDAVGSGFNPSVMSAGLNNTNLTAATYLTNLNSVNIVVDNLSVFVQTNNGISGLNFGNAGSATIGDNVQVSKVVSNTAAIALDVQNTYGIIMPLTLNNIYNVCGAGIVVGFSNGVACAELCEFRHTSMEFCGNGITLFNTVSSHTIRGNFITQQTINAVAVDPNCAATSIDLTDAMEEIETGSWAYQNVFYDPNNVVHGSFRYANWDANTGTYKHVLANGGGSLSTFQDLNLLPAFQTKLLTTAASSVTFSIPTNYTDFKLNFLARGDAAAIGVDVHATFNADSGTNYDIVYFSISAGNTNYGNQHGNNFAIIGSVPAASSSSTHVAGSVAITVPGYQQPLFKQVIMEGMTAFDNLGSVDMHFYNNQWNNTNAVNSVTLTLSSGNFVAGSSFSISCQ